MIICKVDNPQSLEIIRCLYPYDEYEITKIGSTWSWRHWDWVTTAWIVQRPVPLSEIKAQAIILCLQSGKSVLIAKDDHACKILQIVIDILPEAQIMNNRYSIDIKP